jgi:hypothetical protein
VRSAFFESCKLIILIHFLISDSLNSSKALLNVGVAHGKLDEIDYHAFDMKGSRILGRPNSEIIGMFLSSLASLLSFLYVLFLLF